MFLLLPVLCYMRLLVKGWRSRSCNINHEMWVRKTEEKIKRDREHQRASFKVSLKGPIWVFIGFIIIQSFGQITGVRSSSRERPVANIKEFLQTMPLILITSIIVSLILYFSQILYKNNFLTEAGGKITTVICDKCNHKKIDDKKYDCSCGGKYISIKEMEWIDD